jgi:hypothetical protein
MCHEVRLTLACRGRVSEFVRLTPRGSFEAALQDISRCIQLLPDEGRGLRPHWCQYHRRSSDHWQSCGHREELRDRESLDSLHIQPLHLL